MNRLRELRKKNGFTQNQLAAVVNRTRPTYTRWETGQNEPDNDSLIKLAEFYNCSIDYILCKSDNPAAMELHIPEELQGAYIAYRNGDKEPLTQEEVDSLAVHLRVMRELKAKKNN